MQSSTVNNGIKGVDFYNSEQQDVLCNFKCL